MPDLTSQLLPGLQAGRLPGLDLGDGLVYPAYDGFSILNIPGSVCRWLGAPEIAAAPLATAITSQLGPQYRQVILVVMDAMALLRLQAWLADGEAGPWAGLCRDGLLAPLTSITPSTTSAALTALWTGRSAAEHGITGYEMWMKEYGIVANTILQSPISYTNDEGSLVRAGFNPASYLSLQTLGAHLAAHNVKAYAFQHYGILHSGLSRMFFDRVEPRGYFTTSDLAVNLRQLLENRADERRYIYVYWHELDTFSHRYGPDDERTRAEFFGFGVALERLLLAKLNPQARKDTLLLFTADHGQITTLPDPHYELRNHPALMRRLHIQPTGENRLAYLHIRPGQTEAVREYIQRTWPNQFNLVDPAYAVEAGLFGPGSPHPDLSDRLGDLIVVAQKGAYLWWADKENRLVGRHGGLHPIEMLVPFLAIPL